MKRLDKFDYEALGFSEKWCFGEAIDMLTSLEMDIKGYFLSEDMVTKFDKLHNRYWRYVTDLMLEGLLPYVTKCDPEEAFNYDNQGYDPYKSIREFNTYLDKEALLKCIYDDNKVKINVDKLNRFLSGDEAPVDLIVQIPPVVGMVVEHVQGMKKKLRPDEDIFRQDKSEDLANNKYPSYKGIKHADLTDEQFTKLKRDYGMLRDEETKWRRAIPIAAKIGLLFYERNLEKGSKRPAFLKKYKLEFDSLLKNNTVANVIYDSIPEEYRGGSGTPETVDNIDNIDNIIKASVFAGFKEGTEGDITGQDLAAALRDEHYEVPNESTLQKILEAMYKLK